ncbi:hypothetical protein [Verrucosispora sp. NA02020]|uniref:hypothetical protein n=1 Tax=Verrucosispora sp. NA02020 TaxID=2742132 RepID=UPI0020CA80DC|nr:hypothetical protein [Verrucosispora sp. NA02020]
MAAIAGGLLVAGLGAFLTVQGLDDADKWASVLGLFVGLAGLGLAAAGAAGTRRQARNQSVVNTVVGGGVTQVRGVRGSVRLGSAATPPTAAPPVAPPSAPTGGPPAAASGGGGDQLVSGSSVTGPVRQVDEVGGDVEIDR